MPKNSNVRAKAHAFFCLLQDASVKVHPTYVAWHVVFINDFFLFHNKLNFFYFTLQSYPTLVAAMLRPRYEIVKGGLGYVECSMTAKKHSRKAFKPNVKNILHTNFTFLQPHCNIHSRPLHRKTKQGQTFKL